MQRLRFLEATGGNFCDLVDTNDLLHASRTMAIPSPRSTGSYGRDACNRKGNCVVVKNSHLRPMTSAELLGCRTVYVVLWNCVVEGVLFHRPLTRKRLQWAK